MWQVPGQSALSPVHEVNNIVIIILPKVMDEVVVEECWPNPMAEHKLFSGILKSIFRLFSFVNGKRLINSLANSGKK